MSVRFEDFEGITVEPQFNKLVHDFILLLINKYRTPDVDEACPNDMCAAGSLFSDCGILYISIAFAFKNQQKQLVRNHKRSISGRVPSS